MIRRRAADHEPDDRTRTRDQVTLDGIERIVI
jgi:hypothetical protein